MRTIFLDTSYLLALIRKKDARHEAIGKKGRCPGFFLGTDPGSGAREIEYTMKFISDFTCMG